MEVMDLPNSQETNMTSATIDYSFVDDNHSLHSGEWTGDRGEAIDAAADALDALDVNNDREKWLYKDEAMPGRWAVDSDDMVKLGAALLSGVSMGEAYSIWCAESSSEHLDTLVETMPPWLRASHTAAGNSGCWPHNGAIREWMTSEDADAAVDADPEWTSVVPT